LMMLTIEPLAVVNALPMLNTKLVLFSPWKSKIKVPVKDALELKSYTPGVYATALNVVSPVFVVDSPCSVVKPMAAFDCAVFARESLMWVVPPTVVPTPKPVIELPGDSPRSPAR